MPVKLTIRDLEPTMIPAVDGSWLAISGPGAPVRVGAMEPTPELAREAFTRAINRVADLLECANKP